MNINDAINSINSIVKDNYNHKMDTNLRIKEKSGIIKGKKNQKKQLIKIAEQENVDCSIFKENIPKDIEEFYLYQLTQGRNIGLFALPELKLDEIKVLTKELFETDKYSEDDFSHSTPRGVVNAVEWMACNQESLGSFNKYVMHLFYTPLIDVIADYRKLLEKYIPIIFESDYFEFLTCCLVDSLISATYEELELIDETLCNAKYSLKRKEITCYKYLKPKKELVENTRDCLKFYIDALDRDMETERTLLEQLIRHGVIPKIPRTIEKLISNDNLFFIDKEDIEFGELAAELDKRKSEEPNYKEYGVNPPKNLEESEKIVNELIKDIKELDLF